ncbi:DNA adenine methylase [Cernens ardua]|uniref:DNA adenine methylase n=1 Tax=Cernens ardua TaxID=3402176 RepID=UPI003F99B16A
MDTIVAKPIIPWIGGKRRLAKHILPTFSEHTCYVEPFCGAGALFFMKEPANVEVLNDINGDLINLYRVVKYHMEALYSEYKWVLTSRQQWEWLKGTPPETLTDIQRAARFLYLQKLAFGGKVEGQAFGTATTAKPRFNLLTLENDLVDMHQRLTNVHIENLPWDRCIEKYDRPHTLFYCDPPYWQTEGYGVPFEFEQYEKMASLMRSIKGRMLVSINDHPDIREAFKGLPMKEIKVSYSVGGNDRPKSAGELLIG